MTRWNRSPGRVSLLYSEAWVKQSRDAAYLMELDTENLLFPFRYEAGLVWSVNIKTTGSTVAGILP